MHARDHVHIAAHRIALVRGCGNLLQRADLVPRCLYKPEEFLDHTNGVHAEMVIEQGDKTPDRTWKAITVRYDRARRSNPRCTRATMCI